MPGTKDEDKREFLADVSSFANTDGGDIIYGLEEEQGVIANIIGLNCPDFDAEKLRLENLYATASLLELQLRLPQSDPAVTAFPVAGVHQACFLKYRNDSRRAGRHKAVLCCWADATGGADSQYRLLSARAPNSPPRSRADHRSWLTKRSVRSRIQRGDKAACSLCAESQAGFSPESKGGDLP